MSNSDNEQRDKMVVEYYGGYVLDETGDKWWSHDLLMSVERERDAARAEVERLRGMVDDIEVESGHCHFLDDEEHEPPHLPDHVRAIVQERDEVRAEVERLRADLREAISLLRSPDLESWSTRYDVLLAKHKQTP